MFMRDVVNRLYIIYSLGWFFASKFPLLRHRDILKVKLLDCNIVTDFDWLAGSPMLLNWTIRRVKFKKNTLKFTLYRKKSRFYFFFWNFGLSKVDLPRKKKVLKYRANVSYQGVADCKKITTVQGHVITKKCGCWPFRAYACSYSYIRSSSYVPID